MQGCDADPVPARASTAATIRGTTDARILKRNMTLYSPDRSRGLGPYGLQSVKETRYRPVDAVRLTPAGAYPRPALDRTALRRDAAGRSSRRGQDRRAYARRAARDDSRAPTAAWSRLHRAAVF